MHRIFNAPHLTLVPADPTLFASDYHMDIGTNRFFGLDRRGR